MKVKRGWSKLSTHESTRVINTEPWEAGYLLATGWQALVDYRFYVHFNKVGYARLTL